MCPTPSVSFHFLATSSDDLETEWHTSKAPRGIRARDAKSYKRAKSQEKNQGSPNMTPADTGALRSRRDACQWIDIATILLPAPPDPKARTPPPVATDPEAKKCAASR